MEAYCLKCHVQHEIINAERVIVKDHRPATKGRCSVCGGTGAPERQNVGLKTAHRIL